MFNPDSRNNGGRHLIFNEIYSHRQHLSYIEKNNEKEYINYPTYLFRRQTVSEQAIFSRSLSPQSKLGKRKKDKSHHVAAPQDNEPLFRDPLLGFVRRRQQQQKQKLLPFSTVKLQPQYLIKAYGLQLMLDQKDQISDIPWEYISDQLRQNTTNDLQQLLNNIISSYGIYQAEEYEKLILIVTKIYPKLPKLMIYTMFDSLIRGIQLEQL